MDKIRRFFIAHLWWLVLLLSLALLIVHSIGVPGIVVDNTSVILLALVLISPFVAAIKRVKIGDFEAEIQPDEVKRVAQQAEKSLPVQPSDSFLRPENNEAAAAIHSLAESDPVVALAKLRIELESRLRRLHQGLHPDSPPQKRLPALAYVIRDLASNEVFGTELGGSLRDVIAICNRAIHGEDIREIDARQIIDTGIELLEVLERVVREFATTHPVEVRVITQRECDELAGARYRLTTVVPLADNPERRVYLLTQEELDAFFDFYSEFAEFVVELRRTE